MKRRAIADSEKEKRRRTLLDSARELYLANPRQLPTVAAIAASCGLAKGTVYLYFKSKEEIFVALLGDEFTALFARIQETLRSSGAPPERIRRFADGFTDYLVEHPDFLRLASMAHSVLEQFTAPDIVLAFKSALAVQLGSTGDQLESLLGLPPGNGARLLMRTYALSLGLWQAYDIPPAMEPLLATPELQLLRPDFKAELPEAIRQLWSGALSSQ